MRKSNKQLSVNNSNTVETRPELFDFNENHEKTISLVLKNDEVRTGILLCFCPDDVIILEYPPIKGYEGILHIGETPLFDVSDIIVLDN